MVFGFIFSKFISQFEVSYDLLTLQYMICPMSALSSNTCTTSSVFVPYMHALTPSSTNLIESLGGHADVTFIYILPVQIHALLMSVFASLIAPFGGFFASGMKRAFKVRAWF
jgi:phosphatidate cytidylyltransferase